MTNSKKQSWIRLSSLALFIPVFVFVSGCMNTSENPGEMAFDEKEWKENPEKRHELVDDLINSKIIEGKSKSEVLKLLGEPETNQPQNENDVAINGLYAHFPDTNGTGVDFVYFIGTRPGVLEPEQYLFIWFENETVSEYNVRGTYN